LALELAADDYDLSWRHPYGSGQVGVAVTGQDELKMEATAGPSDGHQAPVTVTLTNVGCNPFSGTLTVEAEAGSEAFYADGQPVGVELEGSGVYTFALDTAGLAPGVYSATLAVLASDGTSVATAPVTRDLPGPDLRVSALPAQHTLVASQTVTLTFGLENVGATGDQASLTFSLGDLEDETQMRWLEAGQTGILTYTFFLPADLASGDYAATYVLTGTHDLEGEAGDLVFYVEGLSLTVEAQTDQMSYLEGEPVTITLTIGSDGAVHTGDLQALVAFNGITQTHTFSLAPGSSLPLDFVLAASFSGDSKVFYGVYDADSDRSIYLDTVYLRQRQPRVTLLPDKQVYQPGETLVATLATTLTQGALDLFAPGYAGSMPVGNGNQIAFSLPNPLARGTHALYYVTSGTGTEEDGRERFIAFDVDGPEVFVHAAALRQTAYGPGDTVDLDLTLAADRAVEATLRSYIAYPDRSAGQVNSQPVHLADSVVNRLLATAALSGAQMGPHQMRYQLVQESARGDTILAEGSEPFDVGPAALRRVTTDQEAYPSAADPVRVRLSLFSGRGGPAQLTLHLDEGPVTQQGTTLGSGCDVLTVTLEGPVPPGRRTLTATLEMDGQAAAAATGFAYGTSLPDLRPGVPWVAAGGTVTRTVTAQVSNDGQSAAPAGWVHFFDGSSPIGTVALPELEAGGQATAAVVWDVQGVGGERTLRVAVDPVVEFDTENNQAQAAVTLPRLASGLSVEGSHIPVGGTATVGVWLENLQAGAELPVTATVQIRSPLGMLVHEQAWSETLLGAEGKWLNTSWQSGPEAELGIYSVVQEAGDAYGEAYLNRSSFTVGPVEIWPVYLPLVVRGYAP
jgi:methionine-rich copper-binding protein CopC